MARDVEDYGPGILQSVTVDAKLINADPDVEPRGWKVLAALKVNGDDLTVTGWTETRLVLDVLATALLYQGAPDNDPPVRWPTKLTLEKNTGRIERVRVQDDREDLRDGTAEPTRVPVLPLSPTAFADEDPVKWGFFFRYPGKTCYESKGTSRDVYEIVERAWQHRAMVQISLDDAGYITGAKPA